METNSARCGPLCQHPGCWEGSKRIAISSRRTRYSNYLQGLLQHRFASPRPLDERRNGLPVLTVQSLAIKGGTQHHSHRQTTITTSARRHPASPTPIPHPHQPHCMEMLLRTESTISPSSLSFSPVLIWKPGRRSGKQPSIPIARQLQGHRRTEGRGNVALTTHNLADALPPEKTHSAGKRKARPRSVRTHRKLNPDLESLDFLHDIPPHIVAEILHQLRSESCSSIEHPLTHFHSPAPLTSSTQHSPSHTLPHSTRHTPTQHNQGHSEHPTGEATHVPSSLVCDLSTGQLYSTTPEPARQPEPAATPPPPPSRHQPPVRKGSGHRAIPLQTNMTSFSRELSRRPMAVLRRTEPSRLSPSHHPPLTTSLTLPLKPHPPCLPHPPRRVRYPLGNPVVPRVPPSPSPLPPPPLPMNPPFTHSQEGAQMRGERERNRLENSFLHVCPMATTGLVTLHSSGAAQASEQPAAVCIPSTHTMVRPFSEETVPSPLPKDNNINKAPSSFPPSPPLSHTPHSPSHSHSHSSPSPSHSPTCVSPDHMHVGALICGGQLVLDSGGEQVVHPLREGSSTSIANGNTPSPLGGGGGTQAPPPTATEEGGMKTHTPPSTAEDT